VPKGTRAEYTLIRMISFINQYSAILTYIILGLGILALALWRIPVKARRIGLLVGLGILLFGGLLIFRPVHEGVTAVTVKQTLAVGNGRPVLLEFYSDY